MSITEITGAPENFDKTPPQDVAAEQSVLGGMLMSKDAIADVVETLRGNDFYRPAHEAIYDAVLDLYGRGEPADAVTVSAELTKRGELARIGGAPYLHTLLSSVPTAANAGYYARIVRERAVLRRLVDAGTRIVQLGYATDGGDVDDLVNTAQAEVYAVTERRTAEDYVPLKDVINSTMEEIDAASHRGEGMVGVPTGFTDFDMLTNGLHPGQMIVVAARPAVGKALALDTPLPTPSGWTTMGEVQVGDELLAADGTPTEVVAATEVMTGRPCFEVTFDDGTTIVADAQHQWLTEGPGGPGVRTTAELAEASEPHRVRSAQALGLTGAGVSIDPYTAGVALAGGSDHPEVLLRVAGAVVPSEEEVAALLRGSEHERREFLRGILDVAGSVDGGGRVCIGGGVPAACVRELVVGLGFVASGDGDGMAFATEQQVFGRHDLQLLHKERGAGASPRRILRVRAVQSVPVRCVEIAHSSHLYLASRAMIPTHNSTLGLDIARSASIRNGLTSVIFSLEMSRNEISMRMLSAESQVPLQNMRKGTMRDEDWTRLARTMGRVSEAPLFIDDSPNMSLMEIRAKCRRLKQRHDLKLVVIDYLQLMSSGKRVESRQQEVSEFSRAIKLLAKELEVPVIAISQLNRGSEGRTDKKPQMSDLRESGCLTADTKVLRADTGAEVTMGELRASGARDVPVWALDERLKYVRRHLTHVFSTGTKPVYRLKLASGKELRATANHPFLTYGGWTPLGELEVGSRIGVPRHVPAPEFEAEWDDRKVIMLAHLLGDGSFVARQPIRYASIDEANLTAVTDAAAAFGIAPVRDEYAAARCTTLRLRAPYRLTHGRRNPIAQWLDEYKLFGKRSHEKFIPEPVFHLPKRQIALFIKHLWSTDGSVTVNKSGRSGRVYYASTSRQLIGGLSRLLLRFGISTRLRSVTKGPYRPNYSLDLSGCDDQRRFLQEIGVHGARGEQAEQLLAIIRETQANTNVDTVPQEVWADVRQVLAEKHMTHREFSKAMGTQFCGSTMWKHAPSRQRLGKVAAVLDHEGLEMMAVNDVLWDAVTAIDYEGEEAVYDATVAGGHNFIANGIAVHNSIEQDADVVVLLHREDMYEKESARAGEADIIVAKHRNGPTDTIVVAFQGHYARFFDMAQ